jgi:hypothetical protein
MQQMPDCPSTFVQLRKGYRLSRLDKYDINFVSFTEAVILAFKILQSQEAAVHKMTIPSPKVIN